MIGVVDMNLCKENTMLDQDHILICPRLDMNCHRERKITNLYWDARVLSLDSPLKET